MCAMCQTMSRYLNNGHRLQAATRPAQIVGRCAQQPGHLARHVPHAHTAVPVPCQQQRLRLHRLSPAQNSTAHHRAHARKLTSQNSAHNGLGIHVAVHHVLLSRKLFLSYPMAWIVWHVLDVHLAHGVIERGQLPAVEHPPPAVCCCALWQLSGGSMQSTQVSC